MFEWGEEEGSLDEFVEEHGPKLPLVVCVRDGFDDEEAKHSYASDEVSHGITRDNLIYSVQVCLGGSTGVGPLTIYIRLVVIISLVHTSSCIQ